MAAFFEGTINHTVDRAGNGLKEAIVLASEQLEKQIQLAGKQLNDSIKQASDELHSQRKLTKEDIQEMVDYAALRFSETLDSRIDKLRNESSLLVSQKIAQVRAELTEAASEQKRMAVRNASVAVGASILVGLVSLFYRKYLHGDLDLIDVFRSSMLALAVGYALWLAFKHVGAYFQFGQIKRNAVIVGLGYFDALRPKGAMGQVVVLALIIGLWAIATFSSSIQLMLGK